MDFGWSDEQQQIRKTAREFAEREIAPFVAEYDQEERFPAEIARKAAELGFMGGVVPTEYGGSALDFVSYTIILEEISKVCHAVACALSFPSGLCGAGILQYGTEEQKQKYLKPLAEGKIFAATAVTEPHSGTDVAAMQTLAVKDGDSYVLNGNKAWISFLDVCDFVLTFATLDRANPRKNICAFIIERDTPGMKLKPYKNKLGFRPLSSGDVFLEDCRVPACNRVGAEGQGLKVAMCAVENGRLGVAARALGLAQASYDASVKYARERIVFDQPIGRFQLVQSMLTDMAAGLEGARAATYRLAWMKNQGLPGTRAQASLAKMMASDVALMAATHAVQIHGAYGCLGESPVSRYFRDAKVFQIVEGQNQLHRSVVAEYALGYRSD
ncbi:MAG: acyl-CoA dehydrogenase family protein [Terriglobales bacterium]